MDPVKKEELNSSVEFSEKGKVLYKCICCTYKTAYPSNLKRHLEDQHSQDFIPVYCKLCLSMFRSEDELRHHSKTHESDLVNPNLAGRRPAPRLPIKLTFGNTKVHKKIPTGRSRYNPKTRVLSDVFKKSEAIVYKGNVFDPSELLLKTSKDQKYVVEERPGTSYESLLSPPSPDDNLILKYKMLKNTEFIQKNGIAYPVRNLPQATSSNVKVKVIPQNIKPIKLEEILQSKDPKLPKKRAVILLPKNILRSRLAHRSDDQTLKKDKIKEEVHDEANNFIKTEPSDEVSVFNDVKDPSIKRKF